MIGRIIGFVIWSLFAAFFVGLGIYAYFSKKEIVFWANGEMFEVTDIKSYNVAMSKLFCVYGMVFLILGLPLLSGQNSAWILLSVLGVMIESIIAMIVYTTVIEKKYRRK